MTKTVKWILYTNIFIFILYLISKFYGFYYINLLALLPLDSGYFSPYQLVTYMFCHGTILHIFFNMLLLVSFGPYLEEKFGQKKFLNFYLISGIFGGLTHLILLNHPVIGASGAVWGMLATYGLLNPNQNLYLYFVVPIKAKFIVSILFIYELISSILNVQDGVSHLAHIGGAISGVLFYSIFIKKR